MQQTNSTTNASAATTAQTYGDATLATLRELLLGDDLKNLRVTSDFWEWRKENASRSRVLNAAGVSLDKGASGWTADISVVTVATLNEAREKETARIADEKEMNARANSYMRRCDRAKYQRGGQFGG